VRKTTATVFLAAFLSLVLAPGALGQVDTELTFVVSTDAGATDTLAVGLDPAATSGIDNELGEGELPPLPPGFDARFVDEDIDGASFGTGLDRDYRSGSSTFIGTKQHQLAFQTTDGASSVTIQWSGVPSRVSGTIEDRLGGDQYSKPIDGSGSVTVSPSDADAIITLQYQTSPGSVSFQLGSGAAVQNDTSRVPVRVVGFDNVTTAQFTVEWDQQVGSFAGVENLQLSGLQDSNFGTPSETGENGTLTVSWDDPNGEGLSVADSTKIFTLVLSSAGQPGDSTGLSFVDAPTPKEVTVDFAPVDFLSSPGSFQVQELVDVTGSVLYYGETQGVPNATLSMGESSVTSGTGGAFSVSGLVPEQSYTLLPDKTASNPAEGITTADIIEMRLAILGVDSLSSPEQKIAADVDGSTELSTLDIVLTRQVILSKSSSFPAGFWQFVPAQYGFEDPFYGAPSSIQYSNLTEDLTGQDFTAVKKGDVNGDWQAEGGTSALMAKADNQVTIDIETEKAEVQDTTTVSLRARDMPLLSGLQYSVNWDPRKLSFIGVEPKGLEGFSMQNVNMQRVHRGQLPVAWTHPEARTDRVQDASVMELRFRVKAKNPKVSVSSTPTPRRAYNGATKTVTLDPVEETLVTKEAVKALTMYPASPNPSRNKTVVKYYLPERMEVEIRLYDLLGRTVDVVRRQDQRGGTHSVKMDVSPLRSGVYLLQLNTKLGTKTQKITVVQ
jgi:hypothetical protein